jgi:Cd2+/Zn2+-exporting ATPase
MGDSVKPDGSGALRNLRSMGIRRIAMLTGDTENAAIRAGSEAGIDEIHHSLLPGHKLDRLESIIAEERIRGRGTVLFVGDGTNDAPVLARADAGIAMGGAGSDAAIESADVVLMTDEPSRVAEAVHRARRTRTIVMQNIVFALGFKAAFLAFGAFGLAAMWEAVIADVGVALVAVLNSTRALK